MVHPSHQTEKPLPTMKVIRPTEDLMGPVDDSGFFFGTQKETFSTQLVINIAMSIEIRRI